ncbi:hypothetical protein RUND412_006156 [Rhizina undulata]
MGLLSLVEDRPTPKNVYNWRVYMSAAIAGFAAVMIGYDSAFIGGTLALSSFKDEFGLDKLSTDKFNFLSANIVSLYQAGCFFGAFLGYPAGQFLGRKIGLLLGSIAFVLGAGLMLGANHDRGLGLLYAGRVVAGLGIGACSNLTPIYIAEIAPPAIRGRLVGLYELGWQIGGLVGFWINYGVSINMKPSHQQWIIPFAIQLVPGGLLLIGTMWMKESPRWLLTNGKRDLALKNLEWIRQLNSNDHYMVEEVAAMDAANAHQRETIGLGFFAPFKALFLNKHLFYRVCLGGSLFIWQNGSGINAINYYSPTVFKSIGITGTNASLFTTGIFGVIKTICTIIWLTVLIDHLGRRTLLMIGGVGGGLCMYAVGAYIAISKPDEHASTSLSSGGIVAMFFFYLWTVFYTPTWNGTPWVINAEMFDQQVRTLAQASASANNWLWNFLIARFTPQMFTTMGYGVYVFFATLMICSVPFVFFLVPETKGVPLEEMDSLFSNDVKTWNAHAIVMERVQARNFTASLEEGSGMSTPREKGEIEERVENV